jgi:small subunit ribosomal protein S19
MIKTHLRDAPILPEWVGLVFGVHNGKEFKRVDITADRVGKRLGEFSHSTGRVLHSGPGVGATRGSKFVPLK